MLENEENKSFTMDCSDRPNFRANNNTGNTGNRDSNANGAPRQSRPAAPATPPAPKTADQLFEERLKQFMTESDSKLSSLRQYADHRSKSRRR